MAIVAADWTVDRTTGNVRYIGDDHDGSVPSYATVIQFHRWLQALADDAVAAASSGDELDITNTNPSQRSTDNIITLINGYNIDDTASEHLYDGSIIQEDGDVIYDGIVNFGNADVQIQVIQNGALLADDWWNYAGGGLNASAAAGISHRFMIKVTSSGTDIDGRRLIGICRRFGYTYAEFSINGTSRGNNVLALTDAEDLNNQTVIGTVGGWVGIVNTAEGYNAIDVNNDSANEYYYSKWDRSTYTINQFYERMKWLTKDPVTEAACTDTGSNFIVDNATITGAAQSFAVGVNAMVITKVTVPLKIGAGTPTGNMVAQIFSHSGSYGTSSVPNVQTGIDSAPVSASVLTTDYQEITFNFTTPIVVTASTNYCLVLTHPDGAAGAYVHVRGLATTGTHGGNRSHNTAGWTAVAADDLAFSVYTTPKIYGISGSLFRGITHEVPYTGLTGTFDDSYPVSWTGTNAGTGQILADNGATKMWIQVLTGIAPTSSDTLSQTTPDAASATVGTVVVRTIAKPFCGASTGSAIIGAYGMALETTDLTSSDILTALDNVTYQPPNNVTNTVAGLTGTEDRVLVAPWDGASYDANGDPAINKNQFLLNTALTTNNITAVVIKAGDEGPTIPADTPATGYIRVTDNDGFERCLHYSSWNTSTFTIDTTDGNEDFAGVNASANNLVYLAYIDELATSSTATFTSVQSASRSLVVIVRDGAATPIKQFISSWSQGSSPQTITAIRTTDV